MDLNTLAIVLCALAALVILAASWLCHCKPRDDAGGQCTGTDDPHLSTAMNVASHPAAFVFGAQEHHDR